MELVLTTPTAITNPELRAGPMPPLSRRAPSTRETGEEAPEPHPTTENQSVSPTTLSGRRNHWRTETGLRPAPPPSPSNGDARSEGCPASLLAPPISEPAPDHRAQSQHSTRLRRTRGYRRLPEGPQTTGQVQARRPPCRAAAERLRCPCYPTGRGPHQRRRTALPSFSGPVSRPHTHRENMEE